MNQNQQLIVSLTSFPDKIGGLHLTVKSVLNQTHQADLVVIWLATSQFPNGIDDVPLSLRNMLSEKCQICWCEDMRSYKKLIPTLAKFPEAIIVTVDDDTIYEQTLLEKLLRGYAEHPDCIVVSRATKFHSCNEVLFHDDGGCTYWEQPSYLNKLVGCSGCLYPPELFDPMVLDYETAKKLAPTSDDIWFWLMGVKAGTKVYRIKDGDWYPKHNPINAETMPLSQVNDVDDGNFYKHFDNILNEFPDIKEKLLSSGKNDPVCNLIKNTEDEMKNCSSESSLASEQSVGQSSKGNSSGWAMRLAKSFPCGMRRWPGLKQLYIKYLETKNAKTAFYRYSKRLTSQK